MSELNFIEKLIIKSALQDERFLVMISNTVTRKFFATKESAHIFKHLADHYNAYKQTPSKDMIIKHSFYHFHIINDFIACCG